MRSQDLLRMTEGIWPPLMGSHAHEPTGSDQTDNFTTLMGGRPRRPSKARPPEQLGPRSVPSIGRSQWLANVTMGLPCGTTARLLPQKDYSNSGISSTVAPVRW